MSETLSQDDNEIWEDVPATDIMPVEIWSAVTKYLPWKALTNVRLTCKLLADIAAPAVFRSIELWSDRPDLEKLKIISESKYAPFVKSLYFHSGELDPESLDPEDLDTERSTRSTIQHAFRGYAEKLTEHKQFYCDVEQLSTIFAKLPALSHFHFYNIKNCWYKKSSILSDLFIMGCDWGCQRRQNWELYSILKAANTAGRKPTRIIHDSISPIFFQQDLMPDLLDTSFISNLRSVHFIFPEAQNWSVVDQRQWMTHLGKFLRRIPNLEVLDLAFPLSGARPSNNFITYFDLERELGSKAWPNLVDVRFRELLVVGDDLVSFFARHKTIKRLSMLGLGLLRGDPKDVLTRIRNTVELTDASLQGIFLKHENGTSGFTITCVHNEEWALMAQFMTRKGPWPTLKGFKMLPRHQSHDSQVQEALIKDILAGRYPPTWTSFPQPHYLPNKWTYSDSEAMWTQDYEDIFADWDAIEEEWDNEEMMYGHGPNMMYHAAMEDYLGDIDAMDVEDQVMMEQVMAAMAHQAHGGGPGPPPFITLPNGDFAFSPGAFPGLPPFVPPPTGHQATNHADDADAMSFVTPSMAQNLFHSMQHAHDSSAEHGHTSEDDDDGDDDDMPELITIGNDFTGTLPPLPSFDGDDDDDEDDMPGLVPIDDEWEDDEELDSISQADSLD